MEALPMTAILKEALPPTKVSGKLNNRLKAHALNDQTSTTAQLVSWQTTCHYFIDGSMNVARMPPEHLCNAADGVEGCGDWTF